MDYSLEKTKFKEYGETTAPPPVSSLQLGNTYVILSYEYAVPPADEHSEGAFTSMEKSRDINITNQMSLIPGWP